jgi:hypothetical protein
MARCVFNDGIVTSQWLRALVGTQFLCYIFLAYFCSPFDWNFRFYKP